MARTYRMEFKDSGTMMRFILLYKHLFVAWAEISISQMDYVADRHCYDKNGKWTGTTRGHHDNNVTTMLRQGYRIYDNNRIDIHMEPNDFNDIKGMFRKERIRPGQNKYVFD